MSLNETPLSERIHIGFFGRVNTGKSSLVNAVTGQQLALVSDTKGTTTDPVKKSMELLPLGPVVIIDTAGFDDESSLGSLRMEKTQEVLRSIHMGILVTDPFGKIGTTEQKLIEMFEKNHTPYLIVCNKCDLLEEQKGRERRGDCAGVKREEAEDFADRPHKKEVVYVSAKTGENIQLLKEKMGSLIQAGARKKRLVGDLLEAGDQVVLVIPIDKAAPKGRLILPQQQTIRDILDSGGLISICRDTELARTLKTFKQLPKLVITDSQVFGKVSQIVPTDIMLTSFSILFARYKGNLQRMVEGAYILEKLEETDKVLISEGCTHHRQCKDIGTAKLPAWIKEFTGKELQFSFTSGGEFPEDLSAYSLIIHCGGCMLNDKEMQYRLQKARECQIPMTNYGTAIAHMKGILKRSLEPFA